MEKKKVALGLVGMLIGIGMIYLTLHWMSYGKPIPLEVIIVMIAFFGGGLILIGGGWEYATGVKIPLPKRVRNVLTYLIMMLVGAGLTVGCGALAIYLIFNPMPGLAWVTALLLIGCFIGLLCMHASCQTSYPG